MNSCCNNCLVQTDQEQPHPHLKLVSQMSDSSIYRCEKCEAFWMFSSDKHWEFLVGMHAQRGVAAS
jgi:uncharacterized protein with PIN domain